MPEQAYYQQYRPMSQKSYESFPLTHQVAKFLTASTLSTILLVLSGLTMTGTVIALIVAAPVLVLFSPVLVPAAIIAFLVALGFVFSGGCGVAALSAASWVYSYIAGKHPPGADQLDYAREKLASTARGMTDKAKEYGQHGRERIHEGTRAA